MYVSMYFTGHLTSPTDLNLIIVRNNRVELHLVTPEGLKPLKELTIYGKICCMHLFTPQVSGSYHFSLLIPFLCIITIMPVSVNELTKVLKGI